MSRLYEYYNSGDDGYATSANPDIWLGQTFLSSIGFALIAVKLKLLRWGSPGTLTIVIQATDGAGTPDGNDLTSGTTDGDTLTTDISGEWREITLTEYDIVADTEYAIIIKPLEGSGGNGFRWRREGGGYANGGAIKWDKTVWVLEDYITNDFMFETWGVSGDERHGLLKIKGTRLHYVDYEGSERYLEGQRV